MLFAADIHANICFGTPGASEAEVQAAARAANAAAFIERLPEGYHTQVHILVSLCLHEGEVYNTGLGDHAQLETGRPLLSRSGLRRSVVSTPSGPVH